MGKDIDISGAIMKKRNVECPVCDKNRVGFYVKRVFESLESTWLKCKLCGTVFMDPLPKEQELNDYYRRNYKTKKNPGAVSHSFRYSEENKNIIFNEYRLSLSDLYISDSMLYKKRFLIMDAQMVFFRFLCFYRLS